MSKQLNTLLEGIQLGAYSKQRLDKHAEKFFWDYAPWGFQDQLHKDTQKVRAAFCGNRVGKTLCMVMEIFTAMTGKMSPTMKKIFPEKKVAPSNAIAWICTLTDATIESIILPKIRECVPLEALGITYLANKRQFILPDGKTIFLKSYEQGRDSFQGAGVWMIAFDEECSNKAIYTECMTRLLSTGGYMLITMTPLSGKTWVYYDIYRKAEHDDAIKIYRVNMYEAPHLDDDAIDEILKIYPEHEKRARAYGEFAVAADKRYFSPAKIHKWITERIPSSSFLKIGAVGEPKGTIEDMRLKLSIEDHHEPSLVDGEKINPEFLWEMWESPKVGIGYAMGVDVASGEGSQSDHSVAHIKRLSTNGTIYHCATFRSNCVQPYEFGRLCLWAARFYNSAWVIPESEGLGAAFIAACQFYPFMWHSEVYGGSRAKIGVVMNKVRSKVLENERDLIENSNVPVIYEAETLDEMSLFAYILKGKNNDKFIPDHIDGGRSDGVIASALADFACSKYPSMLISNAPMKSPEGTFAPRYPNEHKRKSMKNFIKKIKEK